MNSEYIYIFNTDTNGYIHYDKDIQCPNICIIQKDQSIHNNSVIINYYKNTTDKDIIIRITSIKDFEGEIQSIKSNDYKIDKIHPITSLKSILIFESFMDYIYYFKSIDESISIKLAEYQKDMNILDILNINDNYFSNCNNRINELKSNTIYIITIESKVYNKPIDMLLQPKILNNNIKITELNDFLYLYKQNNKYILDFSENKIIKGFSLSRLSIDSELIIEDQNEKTIINKNNLYYLSNDILNGQLNIEITKGESILIEFLSQYENDTKILNEKEYTNYKIEDDKILIKFDNNRKNKFINIKINSEKNILFSMISGYSKNNYFHNSLYNQLSNLKEDDTYSMDINIYNEDFQLEKDEYFYLYLIFEKEKISENNIILNKIDKYSTDDFNVYISEEKCKLVIEGFKKIYEDGYVYTEIKKNPPNKDYFISADLISDLNNIKIKDRKYYDFYRDLKEIIGKMRDLHLRMTATTSPKGHNLNDMKFCLPFSFKIIGQNKTDAKIYIDKYDECFKYFNDKEKDFVEKHIGKYIKNINNTSPFDYIQNFNNKFSSMYNKHSTFSKNLITSHYASISNNPLLSEELSNIKFIFEGENEDSNDTIILDYLLINISESANNENIIKSNKENIYDRLKRIKTIDYDDELNNLKEKKLSEDQIIEWDYSTSDRNILCRFDEKNKLNVFKQSSFNFLGDDYKNAMKVVENCTELFYSNPYPIVGIESFNGGGTCKLSFYFQELLQSKILPIHHDSLKLTKLMKEYVEADIPVINNDPDMYERIDIETCKPFSKFEDMKEIIDDYGEGVIHHRSQYFGIFNSSDLKEHKKRRQKYFDMNNLKRPTEILIFTDAYSYSATSFFIKGLQETGGIITAGYLGNPKSNEIFDASQAPSFVGDLSNSEIYQNLLDSGFLLTGVTIYETYNYTYQIDNPTPRDYLIHPVDERVDIFERYSDSIYEDFMKEAKKIFKKYNEDKECNPDNLNLLFDPNNKEECYTFEDIHAHGGYECDPKTKKWSNICKPYYCDIGYYFDKHLNKCLKDICTEDEDDNITDNVSDDGGLESWHIALIVVIPIIIIIIIVFIIFKLRKRKEIEIEEASNLLSSSRATDN